MSNESKKVSLNFTNLGFCGFFFIVLFVLKVGVGETIVTGWSWWIITLPLWIWTALILCCVIIGGLGAGLLWISSNICRSVGGWKKSKQQKYIQSKSNGKNTNDTR